MDKKWFIKEAPEFENVGQLSKDINVARFLAEILVQRGIDNFEKAKDFFRPSLSSLHDPFLMKGMHKAVNRLTDAVSNDEKILLYGDYDVDGTTSVSLLFLFLSSFSDQLEYYIPDRYTEGYGISEKGMKYASDHGFSLIIALDCGIRATERAKEAKTANIDLIICDHHLPGELLPDAFAILDPKQNDCNYPFKELSGCGVGFKLLQGFCHQNTIEKETLFQYLDLVAVSIASDIVPMVGENRILAFYGLKKLNENPSAGLKSLMEISGKKNKFDITDVVFSIGPRINAAGRLGHAKESVRLLTDDGKASSKFADELNERNIERRTFDQSITAEALEMIAELPKNKKSTVLFRENWHKGVIGIVASRCIEHYHRPTIILTESNGMATGSARSVNGFDIHQAISECDELLVQYGGHMHAAGVKLALDNVEPFINRFEEVVSKSITLDQLTPKIEIDTEISLGDISFKTHNIISQMGPFGPHNMTPVFGTKNVRLVSTKILKEKHIKGFVRSMRTSKKFEFIGFGLASKFEELKAGAVLDIAYQIDVNEYLGNRSLILNLKDIRFDA